MKNMLKSIEQTNWIDCKLGFNPASREKYKLKTRKFDDLSMSLKNFFNGK